MQTLTPPLPLTEVMAPRSSWSHVTFPHHVAAVSWRLEEGHQLRDRLTVLLGGVVSVAVVSLLPQAIKTPHLLLFALPELSPPICFS